MTPAGDASQIAQQDKSTERLSTTLRAAEGLPELQDSGSDFVLQPSLCFVLGSAASFAPTSTELAACHKEIREDIMRPPAEPKKDTEDALKAILQDTLKRSPDAAEQQAEDAERTKVAAEVSQSVAALTEALSKR
eukprot:TRINITY_DN1949_c0_g1_i3.p1 TRINITY_DN1949_c0_g1~~TRINITY_DN1949_c0_g1_i3.p1  ORF type:complete len:135 (+),score=44.69 TRINITY_DN1949_c0_g1_i3:157-561(+)